MSTPQGFKKDAITPPTVRQIAQAILLDISQHFHFDRDTWWYPILNKVALLPIRRIASLIRTYDLRVHAQGLRKAAQGLLPHFADGWEIRGGEALPKEGPLLIACNHPGAVDSIAVLAAVERPDVHLVAYQRPTLLAMPNTSQHLLYFDEYNPDRLGLMQKVLHLLRRGEAVLLFPRGTVEPDPARYHGALDSLKDWSKSLGLFLSQVPETMFQLILTQNVLAPQAWYNPIAKLGKTLRQRHQISMILQGAIQEMLGWWKIPVRIKLPESVAAVDFDRNLDPRNINKGIEGYVGAEMEKAFDKL